MDDVSAAEEIARVILAQPPRAEDDMPCNWIRAYLFPTRKRAKFHFLSRYFYYAPVGPVRTEVPLLDDAWSIIGGVDGEYCVSVLCHRDTRWVSYTVYYRVPTNPGARGNVAVHTLGTCPPFAGEFLALRRTENGDGFLDMRPHDRENVDRAITAIVYLMLHKTTDAPALSVRFLH